MKSLPLFLLLFLAATAAATDPAQEIEYLIQSIADSDCVFIRNGKRYEPAAAAKHLRMKLKRGRRYVDDAGSFIERLASKSSMTGKPYRIECAGEAPVSAGDWLHDKLDAYRQSAKGAPEAS